VQSLRLSTQGFQGSDLLLSTMSRQRHSLQLRETARAMPTSCEPKSMETNVNDSFKLNRCCTRYYDGGGYVCG
jgi:hypothetical protein